MDPSPTSVLRVSGNALGIVSGSALGAQSLLIDECSQRHGNQDYSSCDTRNQKIDLQPNPYASTPPSNGPTTERGRIISQPDRGNHAGLLAGPNVEVALKSPRYLPRS